MPELRRGGGVNKMVPVTSFSSPIGFRDHDKDALLAWVKWPSLPASSQPNKTKLRKSIAGLGFTSIFLHAFLSLSLSPSCSIDIPRITRTPFSLPVVGLPIRTHARYFRSHDPCYYSLFLYLLYSPSLFYALLCYTGKLPNPLLLWTPSFIISFHRQPELDFLLDYH